MAPINIKWDPEILAGGFRPSSIFDEAEAPNITTAFTTMAPVSIVGVQSTAAAANPAHNLTVAANLASNITEGLATLAKEMVRQVADLVTNPTTIPSTTASPGSWATITTTTRRAVERVTPGPEILVEHVSIIFIMIC